jgi:hypothetical protein
MDEGSPIVILPPPHPFCHRPPSRLLAGLIRFLARWRLHLYG